MVKIMRDAGDLEAGVCSACVLGPYDQAILGVRALVSRPASPNRAARFSRTSSLRENAFQRIYFGKDANITQNGNYAEEGFIYIPRKGIFITKCSPIMIYAGEATECHRRGKEFYIEDWMAEEATASNLCVRVPDKRTILIPTNRLAEDEITAFAFEEVARRYGEFLGECGVKELPIWTIETNYECEKLPVWATKAENKPFARQLWFYGLMYNGRSGLGGNDRCLHYGNAVRAVPDEDSLGYWD